MLEHRVNATQMHSLFLSFSEVHAFTSKNMRTLKIIFTQLKVYCSQFHIVGNRYQYLRIFSIPLSISCKMIYTINYCSFTKSLRTYIPCFSNLELNLCFIHSYCKLYHRIEWEHGKNINLVFSHERSLVIQFQVFYPHIIGIRVYILGLLHAL